MCDPMKNLDHVEVIGALSFACCAFPTMRIGQIIDNALTHYNVQNGTKIELFYLTDVELAAVLNTYREKFQASPTVWAGIPCRR